MNTSDIAPVLGTLFAELVNGAAPSGGFMLNAGDAGLLASLDTVTAVAASRPTATGSSLAAHVDHVRYGLSLMNRWSTGEDPFGNADWGASWKKTTVTEDQWRTLRADLRTETARWLSALRTPRDVQDVELNGMIGSIAHLAYHLGAVRQIETSLRGPTESQT